MIDLDPTRTRPRRWARCSMSWRPKSAPPGWPPAVRRIPMSTVETLVTCDYCKIPPPAAEVYEPIPGGVVHRCRDVAACQPRNVETKYLTSHTPTTLATRPSRRRDAADDQPGRSLPGVRRPGARPGQPRRRSRSQDRHVPGGDGRPQARPIWCGIRPWTIRGLTEQSGPGPSPEPG